jgi:hypothetical protein
MADTRKCEKCGREIPKGVVYCECGAWVGVDNTTQPLEISIGISKFNSIDSTIDKMLGSDLASLNNIDIDFALTDQRGRSFTPLMAIGQIEDTSLFNVLFAIDIKTNGDFIIGDFLESGDIRLQKFFHDGNLASVLCQIPTGDEPNALDDPINFYVDKDELWFVDSGLSQVKRYDLEGHLMCVLGEEGTADNQLMSPSDLVLDSEGCLWIADTDNNRVVRWTQDGQSLCVLGINKIDKDDDWLMPGTEIGEFDAPQGVALDAYGNLYVADTGNHRIQKFSPTGEFLLAFGEYGKENGALNFPSQLVVDGNDDIYILEDNGSRIQKFSNNGEFLYQVILPSTAGNIKSFSLDDDGNIVLVLPTQKIVMVIAVD